MAFYRNHDSEAGSWQGQALASESQSQHTKVQYIDI